MNNLSEMDIDGATECTNIASNHGMENVSQGRDQASIASSEQFSVVRNTPPLQALQAELDSLRVRKLESVRRFDGDISTLEAAIAVMRRGT